ncbi:hypothetical protein J6590_003293 [Homalodisca vitripennis]|nr:hypothetical protein J6590_003293 [Homalodisca vitripennis]
MDYKKSPNHSFRQFTIEDKVTSEMKDSRAFIALLAGLIWATVVREEKRGIILRQFNASLPPAINFVYSSEEEISELPPLSGAAPANLASRPESVLSRLRLPQVVCKLSVLFDDFVSSAHFD